MLQISAANTARDGSGTLGTLVTGALTGTRVDKIRIMGVGTVTGGMIRIFESDGTNTRLKFERPVTATTPSATVAGFDDELTFPDGEVLPNGWSLKVGTHNAETFNIFANCGDQ